MLGILTTQIEHLREPKLQGTFACMTPPTTIPRPCPPKGKQSLNGGMLKRWRPTTTLSYDEKGKPIASQMSNSSKLAACNSARNLKKADFDPRLQPILAQETGTQEQDCFRTSSGLARVKIQPVHQNPEMAGLARTPATHPTSCSGRSHQHCTKRRRNSFSQPSGRRIRSLRSRYSATHRTRIPQMPVVRVSQMLPSPPRQTSHLSQRSYQARSLRGHLKKQETQLQRQRTRQHLRDRFRYLSRTTQVIIVPGTAAETLVVL